MPIHLTDITAGYPVYEINHPTATARIALHGAHLMEWTPAGQLPVLYLSPQAVFQPGTAIRGGVPVCWPWFGPHPADPALPSHGFARTRFWEPSAASENEAGVSLKFTLSDDASSRRLWAHAFRLELDFRIGAELRMSLRMVNTGGTPFTITGALHSYFAVGDIRQVRLTGLGETDYLDTAGTPRVRRQEGDLTFNREVDRTYRSQAPVGLHDDVPGRVLTIEGAGSRSTVVWNPWTAKAITLTDLPDGDFRHFLCVETANAGVDDITLAPGASHELSTTVRVN